MGVGFTFYLAHQVWTRIHLAKLRVTLSNARIDFFLVDDFSFIVWGFYQPLPA